jgi:hypothetical protein
MVTHIQQDDFLVRYDNGQCDSIAIGNADSLNPFELSTEVVVFQVGLERVALQVPEDSGELDP